MIKRILLLLIILVAMATGQAAPGWCGPDVSIKARPGLAGIYKVNGPVLIDVDVDSGGERVTGRLVLISREAGNTGVPAGGFSGMVYGCEVDVPAGQKAAYSLVVPGEVAASTSSVRLMSGNVKLAETGLDGAGVGGGMVIMPLDEKFLGSSLFTWLDKKYGGQVMVKYLPAEEFPDRSLLLRAADVIVADRNSLARLGESQKKVLLEWVRLGGRLLLSGQSVRDTGGSLAGLPIVWQAGQGWDGAVAREPLGRGEIIITRTPIEAVSDRQGKVWEEAGIASWAEDLLTGKKIDEGQFDKNALAEAGSYLPLAKKVGIPALIALWLVYVLVVGPGMYILLKKLNRRDLAWAAVPAVAVLTAAGLFTLSPVNRLKTYISYTMSTVDIVDRDLAEVKSAGTFVLPRGGSLEVGGPGDMLMEPLYNFVPQGGNKVTVLGGSRPMVVFDGVAYGSMRQVFSSGTMTGVGSIDGTAYFQGDHVSGRIANNTGFNLSDCRILVGKSLIDLGSLPSGGVRELDEPLSRSLIVSGPREVYQANQQYSPQYRENAFITEYASRQSGSGSVVFMGWSDSPVSNLKVLYPSGQGQEGGRTLIRQRVDIRFPEGAFKLPAGYIKNAVDGLGGGYGEKPEGLFVQNGSVKITYDLRDTLNTDKYTVTGIEVQPPLGQASYTIEIFNQATARWDRVEGGSRVISGKQAPSYVSAKGTVEVRLTSTAERPGNEGVFRGISVEGVIGS